MTELFTKVIDINPLSSGAVIELGSANGSILYLDVTGVGFINEDSTWFLVQSNDRTNWIGITGTDFTGENASDTKNPGAVFNAVYLGVQLINKFTETDGVVTVIASVKE